MNAPGPRVPLPTAPRRAAGLAALGAGLALTFALAEAAHGGSTPLVRLGQSVVVSIAAWPLLVRGGDGGTRLRRVAVAALLAAALAMLLLERAGAQPFDPVGPIGAAACLAAIAITVAAAELHGPPALALAAQSAAAFALAVCGVAWMLLACSAWVFGAAPGTGALLDWGLMTALAGGWAAWAWGGPVRERFERDRVDRQILVHHVAAMALLTLAAGLLATGLFAQQTLALARPLLRQAVVGHALALGHRLEDLAARPDDARGIGAELPLPTAGGRRLHLRAADVRHGLASADAPWPLPRHEVLACMPDGEQQARCLSADGLLTMRLGPRADGRRWPVQRAWDGESGVMLTPDRSGEGSLVAFAPVAGWPLALAHKVSAMAALRVVGERMLAAMAGVSLLGLVVSHQVYRRGHARVRELRWAKARADATLDVLPQAVLTLDAHARVLSASAGALQLLGAQPAQLLGQPLAAWMADERLPALGRAEPEAVRVRRADGTRLAAELASGPMHFEGEAGWAVVLRDVSELRRAREFFERSFGTAPVGMFVADGGGHVLQANAALARFLDRPPAALAGQPVLALVDPRDRAAAEAALACALAGAAPAAPLELRLRRRDGGSAWGLLVMAGLDDPAPGAPRVVGQVQDIDDSRRTREALRESEANLAQAERIAGLGHWTWPVGSAELRCSRQTLRILGLADDAPLLQGALAMSRRAHPDDRALMRAAIDAAAAGGPAADVDVRIVRPDGSVRRVHQVAELVAAEGGRPARLIATLQDITDSRLAEHELRASREALRELLAYDEGRLEEERKRIAREVHDELGQMLTALRLDVTLLGVGAPQDPALQARAQRMRAQIDETIAVVRHVATNLRPAVLDLGLVPALDWLAEDFHLRWDLPCTLAAGPDAAALHDEVIATAVFRMVQECLTNVARHARAHSVQITLACDDRQLLVTVQDDGVGFDPDAPAGGHYGLLGMRERALKAGGALAIDSRPGAGTRITIRLPLP